MDAGPDSKRRRLVFIEQPKSFDDVHARLKENDAAAHSVVVAVQLLTMLNAVLDKGRQEDVKLVRAGQINMGDFLARAEVKVDAATRDRLTMALTIFQAAGSKIGGPVATECGVCLSPCQEPITPPCGHVMCGAHLPEIQRTSNRCPQCKGSLDNYHRVYL